MDNMIRLIQISDFVYDGGGDQTHVPLSTDRTVRSKRPPGRMERNLHDRMSEAATGTSAVHFRHWIP